VKNDQKLDIKDVNEKCNAINEDLEKMLLDDKDFIIQIDEKVNNLSSTFDIENEKIGNIFNSLTNYIEQKKKEILDSLHEQYKINISKINENKQNIFSQLEEGKYIQADINEILINKDIHNVKFQDLLVRYNSFSTSFKKNNQHNIDWKESKIVHDELVNFQQYLMDFFNLKSQPHSLKFPHKHFKFQLNKNNKIAGLDQ